MAHQRVERGRGHGEFVSYLDCIFHCDKMHKSGAIGAQVPSHWKLIATVAVTTIVWVVTTYVTEPTDRATLLKFYRQVRPAGPGWESVRNETGLGPSPDSMAVALGGWVLGCVFVYSALFGTGSYLYGNSGIAMVWTAIFVVSGIGLWRMLHLGQTRSTTD